MCGVNGLGRAREAKSVNGHEASATAATMTGHLHGRAAERAALDSLLRQARSGLGGCLVLHGEPGIGKTMLLEYAAERARDIRVLRAAGTEVEADLGYAAVHRLLVPVLDKLNRLPAPQARALGTVLGRTDGPAPDRLLVAMAALSLLSGVASERPLVCLVDDAHWIDAASQDVLTYVARRVDSERVAMVMAMRTDEGGPLDTCSLDDVLLTGLDHSAALQVLTERSGAGLTTAQRERLLRATGSNPQALSEVPVAALRGAADEPVPLSSRLQDEFLKRANGRDRAGRRMLLLVAAYGTGATPTVRRAATILDGNEEAGVLDDLADLIDQDGTTVAFRHPLIRSAVYYGASSTERREAHRALALASETQASEHGHDVAGGSEVHLDRQAWHLARAAAAPDERIAELVDRSATRMMRREGPAAAAIEFDRAAELSTSEPARVRRLVMASDAWWQAGDSTHAAELMNRVEHVDHLPDSAKLDLAALRALSELRSGTPYDVVDLLQPLIPQVLRSDRERAVRLLMLFGEGCLNANAADAYAAIGAPLNDLHVPGDDPSSALLRLFRAAYRVCSCEKRDLKPSDLEIVERLTDPIKLCWASALTHSIGEPELARRLGRSAVQRAKHLGAAGTLAWALEAVVSDDISRGQFALAEAHAQEGYDLAMETGQPNIGCQYQSWLVLVVALRGQEREAYRRSTKVLADAHARGLVAVAMTASRALGLLHLAAGRHDQAITHFQSHGLSNAVHPRTAIATVPDLIDAAVHANRKDLAVSILSDFVAWADATGSAGPRALAARCQAQLAPVDAAEDEFRRALQLHAASAQPVEQARTELLFGEHLRRIRRRLDARTHLRAAMETFQHLGMLVWANRAQQELRATGETSRRRQPSATRTLTPQELRIIAAVSQGATNREAAAQLSLSPRTVDYHMRKVFRKLGISSRGQLIRLTLDHGLDLQQEPSKRPAR